MWPSSLQNHRKLICILSINIGYLTEILCVIIFIIWGFPDGSVVKNLPAIAEDAGLIPGLMQVKIPWRRKWQPTPVFLLGKFHGQRNPVSSSPWGRRVGHD